MDHQNAVSDEEARRRDRQANNPRELGEIDDEEAIIREILTYIEASAPLPRTPASPFPSSFSGRVGLTR